MPWYPKAVRKQLTYPNRARNKVRMTDPTRINLHTAVSNGGSIYNFFNSSGAKGVFSHFYVTRDGGVEQYQDTDYRASCDLDGNADTISIETWDGYRSGYPGYWKTDSDVPPWNDAQVRAIVDLVRWIYEEHPTIPRKLATDNRRGITSHGLSWHRLGVVGAPGYVPVTSGGLRYSTSVGKICPGPRRIGQVPGILRAAMSGYPTAVGSGTTTPRDWYDMADIADLKKALNDVLWEHVVPGNEGHLTASSWRNNVLHIQNKLDRILALLGNPDAFRQAMVDAMRAELAARPNATAEQIAESVAAKLVDGVEVTVAAKQG